MSNQLTTQQQASSIQQLLNTDKVKNRLSEILGRKASTFATSVIQIAHSNDLLKNADPQSILNAALMATTLDLPLNNTLGFSYIVPFRNNKTGQTEAQLQLGYRAYIQLAQRSGQFKRINVTDVREGELIANDRLSGEIKFEWLPDSERGKKEVVGYVAYFELLNGYSHTLYMTVGELEHHAKKYSQTYKNGYGMWKNEFDGMCKKTMLKLLLSKYAPLSVEMQMAIRSDQGVIRDYDGQETIDVDYVDNSEPATATIEISEAEQETQRLKDALENTTTIAELDSHSFGELTEEQAKLVENKRESLTKTNTKKK